ncbi:flagellar hook-associated protein FlgL [Ameyamaea chiangmaiensis NBRC 103196]|uniref:Flagellin n=1 Tax=Ameyamaea chiangmaiensis TaxID=442969 RepID=A0A850PBM4_9PROT|nr:flagellin [Ameyamaea chiangmaiensis]MBS4075037.1 flagellin [Ameyamaea chiangmaiensis]NVN40079.1 flagellin [Ameyamaea chiangmaiensis]GBQ65693.1 flagellar hook-associated protein FlgL [Ameyamaea chiangmaiensis NBRC 103196]
MSSIVGQYGTSGTSLILDRAISTLSLQQQALQNETASGTVSDTYAGLGNSAAQVLNIKQQVSQVSAWQANVTTAQTNLTTSVNAVNEIASLASSLTTTLTTLQTTPTHSTVAIAASTAKSALATLQGLLNTQNGSTYVLGGANGGTPVIAAGVDLADGSLAKAISASVAQVSDTGTDAVLAQTLSFAADNSAALSPFSAILSVAPQTAAGMQADVSISQSSMTATGFVATQGGTASDTSTGSAMRDLIRNLMVVASLGSVSATTSQFSSLVTGVLQSNASVVSSLNETQGQLGVQQNALSTRAATLTQLSTALSSQYSTLVDADLATVSTQLSQTQLQLQASYTLVADMKGLSLANYI